MAPKFSDKWDTFKATALRGVDNPVQIDEMQKAFYAGAETVFMILLAMNMDNEEHAAKELAVVSDEVHAWIVRKVLDLEGRDN